MRTIKWSLICLFIIFCYAAVFADYQTKVYTPRNSEVAAIVYTPDLSSADKLYLDNLVALNYPKAKKLRGATLSYNCHSYAWHSTSTSNIYWIPDSNKYWTDGSYTLKAAPAANYKVLYGTSTPRPHSGIVKEFINGIARVQSKWGMSGLYEHDLKYVPPEYESGVVNFYTR